jgi:hypothetical protein
MANIIYDEKRTVGIGEVCAINLKNIHPIYLALLDPNRYDDIVNFYSTEITGISSDDEITFIKYVGNGMFMDLVSDQLLMTRIFNEDDFGTDDFHMMDVKSQQELIKMQQFWTTIQNPKSKSDFSESFSIFIQNPLAINIAEAPFMSINAENAKKFASQSLEQVRSKLMSAKARAQQDLKQKYSEYEGEIVEYYSDAKKEETPKTM